MSKTKTEVNRALGALRDMAFVSRCRKCNAIIFACSAKALWHAVGDIREMREEGYQFEWVDADEVRQNFGCGHIDQGST